MADKQTRRMYEIYPPDRIGPCVVPCTDEWFTVDANTRRFCTPTDEVTLGARLEDCGRWSGCLSRVHDLAAAGLQAKAAASARVTGAKTRALAECAVLNAAVTAGWLDREPA